MPVIHLDFHFSWGVAPYCNICTRCISASVKFILQGFLCIKINILHHKFQWCVIKIVFHRASSAYTYYPPLHKQSHRQTPIHTQAHRHTHTDRQNLRFRSINFPKKNPWNGSVCTVAVHTPADLKFKIFKFFKLFYLVFYFKWNYC